MDTGSTGNFTYAFLQGYQTGDVAVGIVIAGTFIASIKAKGYQKKADRNKAVTKAAIVALIGLLIVYGGLLYLGATGSGMFDSSMDQTALLVALVETCIGRVGTAALGVGILLALSDHHHRRHHHHLPADGDADPRQAEAADLHFDL